MTVRIADNEYKTLVYKDITTLEEFGKILVDKDICKGKIHRCVIQGGVLHIFLK